MKNKIFIALGVLIVLIVAVMFYMNNRNRTLSPVGQTDVTGEGMEVSVEYSRPSVRDRLIFGEQEEGALLPYEDYWRLGANEPTLIEVSEDFMFGETKMAAGKYVIYAFPHKFEMELRLNAELRFWGYTEPDYAQDIATVIVPITRNEHVEQFTIEAKKTAEGVNLAFTWGTHQWDLMLGKL